MANPTTVIAVLQTAKNNKILYPKIKLGRFTFTLAPLSSANAGCAYIKIGDTYLGKLCPNGVLRISPFDEAKYGREIIAVLADVTAAATAYGRQTGNCCICGRLLTAKESVAHSIGPICASKYGLVFQKVSPDNMEIPDDF